MRYGAFVRTLRKCSSTSWRSYNITFTSAQHMATSVPGTMGTHSPVCAALVLRGFTQTIFMPRATESTYSLVLRCASPHSSPTERPMMTR